MRPFAFGELRLNAAIRKAAPFKKYLTATVVTIAPSQLLKGKNIVVTGGGRGLGYYIAPKCISEGADVLITGRNDETLKKAADRLGEHCKFMKLDVQSVGCFPDFWVNAARFMGGG